MAEITRKEIDLDLDLDAVTLCMYDERVWHFHGLKLANLAQDKNSINQYQEAFGFHVFDDR